MAHPDIVIDAIAIAQTPDLAQQPGRGQIIAIIIARRHFQIMFGQHHIAGIEHHPFAITANFGQLCPALDCSSKIPSCAGIAGGNQRQEHTVNVAGKDRIGLARQQKAAIKRTERQRDDCIFGRPRRIVPQADKPAFWQPRRIAPFDGQCRAIDGIQRHDALRLPAKAQR